MSTIVDVVPTELRSCAQWVLWRFETRQGEAKPTKVPYQAKDPSRHATTIDPTTWSTFETAVSAIAEADGIGFVFTKDDPYAGVDLDACIGPEGMHPDAAAILLTLDSYSEISPSGTGVKAIVRAGLNGFPRNRTSKTPWRGVFEVYDHARFFTITANLVRGCPPTVGVRQAELDQVLEHVFGKPDHTDEVRISSARSTRIDLDDRDLLERAFRARNGKDMRMLFAGAWQGMYGSQSEADLAFCSMLAFWTGRDIARIDAIFRMSGLMRPKWDDRRGETTYGIQTIEKAIASTTEVYTPPAKSKSSRRRDDSIAPAKPGSQPQAGHLTATPLTSVKMRSIVWFDRPLWQQAAFTLLAAPKGAGKGTYLAGLGARVSRDGQNVLFVSSEDSVAIDLKPRLVAAGAAIERCFVIQQHVRLPDDVGELQALASSLGGIGLLVVDPVANHVGDRNSNNDVEVRDAIAPLNGLADELRCMLIGVRHPGKDRSRGAVASILGSTAWVDTPRAVVMIAVDDEDDEVRHIQVVAGNRSRNGAAQAFRIEAVNVAGLTEPITIATPMGESTKTVDQLLGVVPTTTTPASKTTEARELILDILETEGEQESDTLDARVAKETSLKATTVRNARTALKDEGLINVHPDRDDYGSIERWKVFRTGAPRS
jgi:hypothetical protein